ncbi:MAG: hypothetical protein J0I68_05050 [Achromobacter sp.]|jgi:hypothetical protein|uniref:Uncharacterized protein n=2 Tax=Alcaligenaceae TaxID=506 RepID=A0A6J4ZV59_9BURK|nr:hypothetical protein [Achromobacter sp.]CAB3636011.1 hypothetical protein LMG26845_01662 [Achromobacter insuavis]CUI67938.1 Uncharacterised protein [Achromobacter sp. 2789STDY5608628]CUI80562.1 Uncharacterised protein [Achromobacter sp. 2789STDY5608633]
MTAMTTPTHASPAERDGFWFDAADPSLALERAGSHVRLARAEPPWIVVDQSIASLTLGRHWPGQLWRVRVTQLGDMSGLVAQPGYWRAAAIELLQPLPLALLFGPHGEGVLDVLARIPDLSREQARALGEHLPDDGWDRYGRAWARWSSEEEGGATAPSGAVAEASPPSEWYGVLAASRRRGGAHSPVHAGFMQVHKLLRQRAEAVDGEAAFIREVDEDGEVDESLAPPWDGASDALLFAAMARGAPQYLSADDVEVLARPWRGVFGEPG